MLLSMAVMMPRERWTDARIDKAFDRVDADIRELRTEMRNGFELIDRRFDQIDARFDQIDERFGEVNKRFEKIDTRFERIDDRFYNLQRNMMTWFISGMVVVLVAIISA
jgi:archaellum component FlaC